ncbi:hypothetical protein [Anabaena sp. CCY 9402-a]|uniref:hypothetical protein n=1 Tax=Anabaena sp. CCY 9402-a TaxID=3103867 RepID=UPI0039C663EE
MKAQNSNGACKQVINNAKTRLQRSAKSSLVVSIKNAAHDYPDAPVNRKRVIVFYLDYFKDPRPQVRVGIQNILQSPQLIKSISQNIISKCASTGAVYFGSTFQAGCPVYLGLMRNGTIEIFEPIVPGELSREIKWGENYCY